MEEILGIVRFTARRTQALKAGRYSKINYDVEKFEALVKSLVGSALVVFDIDWEHTRSCLQENYIEYFISENGNFLEPKIDDEGNNWANRTGFLIAFRKLNKFMSENNMSVSFHDEDVEDLL